MYVHLSLSSQFVDHCLADTKDCPEVLDYLKTRHTKASPEYLSSVEFRNTLGRCLTRAQAQRSKTFVYINELCTVLKQHAAKKRQVITKVEPDSSTAASVLFRPTSPLPKSNDAELKTEGDGVKVTADNTALSPSGRQKNKEDGTEEDEMDKKKKKASRKQVRVEQASGHVTAVKQRQFLLEESAKHWLVPLVTLVWSDSDQSFWRLIKDFSAELCETSPQIAYLENLLKMYNEEIHRLQKSELSLNDLDSEDSLFIQESKLKRKVSLEDGSLDESRRAVIPPHPFSLPSFSVNEDLRKVVWAERLQHTYRKSNRAQNRLQQHPLPWNQQEGGCLFVLFSLGLLVWREDGEYLWMYISLCHISCMWMSFFSCRQIERFINSPEAQENPPDYQDILQQMLRANERYGLCLSRKQLNQMAKEAFREVGTRIQDRRHLDLVYNFGSHLTDPYKPGKGGGSSSRGAQQRFLFQVS